MDIGIVQENGVDTGANFVGRESDMNVIAENWSKYRLIGIFGARSVGKSRFCLECVKRQRNVGDEVLYFDTRWLPDVTSLFYKLCSRLGFESNTNPASYGNWVRTIVGLIKRNENRIFIIVFDNTEDFQDTNSRIRDAFLSLCINIARYCANAKILVTSSTRIQMTQIRRAYFSYEVLPFTKTESLALLNSELEGSGVDIGEYSDALVRLCEGLPLLLLMVSSELIEDGGMLTPRDMVELLATCRLNALSREFYPEEDRVADVYRIFIARLREVHGCQLLKLADIPDTFSASEALTALDISTEAAVKDQALIPVRRRHYLRYDPTSRRFDIQGILRECLHTAHPLSAEHAYATEKEENIPRAR